MSSLQVHALRLGPGSELVSSLRDFVDHNGLRAPFILTCVGSVTTATLRLANATAHNQDEVLEAAGPFEIVSLVGTLNPEAHLHVCLSDSRGRTVGGHVLGNMQVFTTAEVLIGEARNLVFNREMDPKTGFRELQVQARGAAEPGLNQDRAGTQPGLNQDRAGTQPGLNQDRAGTQPGLNQDRTWTQPGLSQD